MTNAAQTARPEVETNNPFDIFLRGVRKGWVIVTTGQMPNVLMAFVITYILDLLGVLQFLGHHGGFMAVFGLPGEAITVLLATWLSCGAGVGVAASLLANNTITPEHVTIMAPALITMASQIQYMGRLLGIAGCPTKYWPMLMVFSVVLAMAGMLIMRIFVV